MRSRLAGEHIGHKPGPATAALSRRLGAVLGVFCWLLGLAPSARAEPPNILRLADQLPNATIKSPLTQLEALDSLLNIDQNVPSQTVFSEGFESFSRKSANWSRRAPCSVAPRGTGGGKALHYAGGRAYRCAFVLPAAPSSHYVIRRAIKTRNPAVDFRIIESRAKLKHPQARNHPKDLQRAIDGKFVGLDDLVHVHRLPQPRERDQWQSSALHVFTSPFTHSLVVLLQDARNVVAGGTGEAWFDDLSVARLRPTRKQELRLLKGYSPAEDSDADLGLRKHGQLLPVRNADSVEPPFDRNFDYRHGLLAVAPSALTFPVSDIAKTSVLRFSYGLIKMARPGDAVTFRVIAKTPAGQKHTLFERSITLDGRGSQWHWHSAEVALGKFAGKKLELTLQTSATQGKRGYGIWGNPHIEIPRRQDDPPNVIVVAVDTLRADRMGLYGHTRDNTPNLDKVAAESIVFEDAVSPSNWTSSAFGSVFTGVMPSRHRVIHRARSLPRGLQTLTEDFRQGGWTTHAIVYKPYLYNMGFEQGFDVWFNRPQQAVTADANLKSALSWLKKNHDRRFFLFFHLNDPHQPFNQPEPFDRKYVKPNDWRRFRLSLPIIVTITNDVLGCARCDRKGGITPGFRPVARALYDGSVAYVDDRLGKFFRALQRHGVYDDSIIVFLSDHGEMMWEHDNYFGHGGELMVEPLVHVPFFIKPAKSQALKTARRVDNQVSIMSMMPTLLDMVGLEHSGQPLESPSLLPAMRSKGTKAAAPIVASENVKQRVLALRRPPWKYVVRFPPADAPGERLYRLAPTGEQRSQGATAHPKVVGEFRTALARYIAAHRPADMLVVQAPANVNKARITLTAKAPRASVHPVAGLPLRRSKNNRWVFAGITPTRTPLVVRLAGAAGSDWNLRIEHPGRDAPHTISLPKSAAKAATADLPPGTASSQWQAWRIRASPELVDAVQRSDAAGQQLDSLRVPGYIE